MRRRPIRASIWLVACVLFAWASLSPAPLGGSSSTVSAQVSQLAPVAAPAGTEGLGAAWYVLTAPDGHTMHLALFDPRAAAGSAPGQPAPAVLVLHGSHGFAQQYVQIAHDLAEQTGYVVAAGCWFAGAAPDADVSTMTPIDCPGGPEFVGATANAWPAVRALGDAVRGYAGTDRLAIFGHARGAEVALQLASSGDPSDAAIQAVVSSSGIYTALPRTPDLDTPTPLSLAERLAAPVLMLHGLDDARAHVANATLYYQKVRSLGKPAQCILYPRAGQDAILQTSSPNAQDTHVFQDGIRRSAAFFSSVFSESASVQAVDCVPA